MDSRPYLIGLTGGIGSGKSTIADAFVALGGGLVDTDAEAHALTAPSGAAIEPIRAAFGDDVIAADGSLDRAAMRQIVFSDSEARQRLEAILHPMIGARCEAAIAAQDAPYVLLAVPLLVESGNWIERVNRVLVVDCDEELQLERVIKRSGLDRDQVRAIMDVQVTREERRAAADDVIDNSQSLSDAKEAVATLHEQYLVLASEGSGDAR